MTYLLLLPLSWAFTLLAIALAPVLPLFVKEDKLCFHWLPSWLWWFQTPDNSLEGDVGHSERWMESTLPEYFQMVAWLLRNPAYGFEWTALAVEPRGTVTVKGNPWIKNRDNAVAGWYFATCDNAWNFKSVTHLFRDLALQLEFGWRLQPWEQGRGEGRAMYVFSVRLTAFNP
jgi:hypothetical protein